MGSWRTNFYSGEADEAAVYTRALSSVEMTALYNSGQAMALPLFDSFELPLEAVDTRPVLEVVEV